MPLPLTMASILFTSHAKYGSDVVQTDQEDLSAEEVLCCKITVYVIATLATFGIFIAGIVMGMSTVASITLVSLGVVDILLMSVIQCKAAQCRNEANREEEIS